MVVTKLPLILILKLMVSKLNLLILMFPDLPVELPLVLITKVMLYSKTPVPPWFPPETTKMLF